MGDRRVQIVVRGRVQGVFFRASALERAEDLGLRGWVRNRPSGDVEIVAEGDEAAVAELVAWCHHGPPAARVEHVDVREDSSTEVLQGFRLRR
ncbi:MAG: acylphosphatase [Candidatus Binatia bacterium]